MNTGIVRSMPEGKQFGFIRDSKGIDYFFHREDFLGRWDDLVDDYRKSNGQPIEVEFEAVKGAKGLRGQNVSRT